MLLLYILIPIALILLFFAPKPVKSANVPEEFATFRHRCDCGSRLTKTGRLATVQIYTRAGTSQAKHMEYR